MWQYVSLSRNEEGLLAARQQVRALRAACEPLREQDPRWLETLNILQVSELIIAAALKRQESRGSHWRTDYQLSDERLGKHHFAFYPQHRRSMLLPHTQEEVTSHVHV
jgi:L-aspartate oxidase